MVLSSESPMALLSTLRKFARVSRVMIYGRTQLKRSNIAMTAVEYSDGVCQLKSELLHIIGYRLFNNSSASSRPVKSSSLLTAFDKYVRAEFLSLLL